MRIVTVMIMLAVIALGATGTRAAEVPEAVTRTHVAVQRNARDILKFAYPMARGMNAATVGKWDSRGDGFALDETFYYDDSDKAAQSFTLRFNLDPDGRVTSLDTLYNSEKWPPFITGSVLLAIVKTAAQDQVEVARRDGRDPPAVAVLILKTTDIRDVVVLVLNFDRST